MRSWHILFQQRIRAQDYWKSTRIAETPVSKTRQTICSHSRKQTTSPASGGFVLQSESFMITLVKTPCYMSTKEEDGCILRQTNAQAGRVCHFLTMQPQAWQTDQTDFTIQSAHPKYSLSQHTDVGCWIEQGARVRRQRQPSNADTLLQVYVWCYWLNESSIFCDATTFDLHPLVRQHSR